MPYGCEFAVGIGYSKIRYPAVSEPVPLPSGVNVTCAIALPAIALIVAAPGSTRDDVYVTVIVVPPLAGDATEFGEMPSAPFGSPPTLSAIGDVYAPGGMIVAPVASWADTVNVSVCVVPSWFACKVVGFRTIVAGTPPSVTAKLAPLCEVLTAEVRPVAIGVPLPSVDAYDEIASTTDAAIGTVMVTVQLVPLPPVVQAGLLGVSATIVGDGCGLGATPLIVCTATPIDCVPDEIKAGRRAALPLGSFGTTMRSVAFVVSGAATGGCWGVPPPELPPPQAATTSSATIRTARFIGAPW